MAKPDYAFKTASHSWYPTERDGVYRTRPGGAEIALSLERQEVPHALLEPGLKRAVTAWVIARGGRTLHLNGRKESVSPRQLDRPPTVPVRRLVSIAPSNAEIVGALGAVGLLVGVESSSDFPPEIKRLPRLGPDLHVDMEALSTLRPDLVLASLTVPGMERNLAGLDVLGVPVLVLAPGSIAEIEADVLRVGEAIGHADQARRAVDRMEADLRSLREAREARAPVRVFLQWWHNPMFSPARACWSNELIEHAGGVNVFRDLPGQSAQVGPEAVVAADPEVIFISWCGVPFDRLNAARVLRRKDLGAVTAIREGRVYALDEALLGRPGPRVVQGVARMAEYIRGVSDGRTRRRPDAEHG